MIMRLTENGADPVPCNLHEPKGATGRATATALVNASARPTGGWPGRSTGAFARGMLLRLRQTRLACLRGFEGCVSYKSLKIKACASKVFTTTPYLASWPEAVIFGGG